jgi:chemotaxis protein MotB
MAGKGGGAWKVAYADFVTAMMAFFMVMWLTTQKEGVKEAVAGYFREPFATVRGNETGAAATVAPVIDPKYGHLAQPQKRTLLKAGDAADYQFTVLFKVGTADLEEQESDALTGIAEALAGKLNRVEVRAHCLRRPLPEDGPFKNHWELCFAQCEVVKNELEARGIEPQRIRLSQAEGNEPLAINLSKKELKLNSRVDVILLSDLAEVPWKRAADSLVSNDVDHDTSHVAHDAQHLPPSADSHAAQTDQPPNDHAAPPTPAAAHDH